MSKADEQLSCAVGFVRVVVDQLHEHVDRALSYIHDVTVLLQQALSSNNDVRSVNTLSG